MQSAICLKEVAAILNQSDAFRLDVMHAVRREILRREREIKQEFDPLTRHFTEELIKKHSDLSMLRMYLESLEDLFEGRSHE